MNTLALPPARAGPSTNCVGHSEPSEPASEKTEKTESKLYKLESKEMKRFLFLACFVATLIPIAPAIAQGTSPYVIGHWKF